MHEEPRYGIKVVARRTGLTLHVIRIWEKRYHAVSPLRTDTNRRLYSEAEIERLILLRQATLAGHAIGQVAPLSNERIQTLLSTEKGPALPTPKTENAKVDAASTQFHLDTCIAAVKRLDAEALEAALLRATVVFSKPVLIDQILIPLIHEVGDLWREGTLRVMHEHLTTSVVRTVWGNIKNGVELPASAPRLIVTTPAGQVHELGALLAASVATTVGWRVTYLGPNLPAEEIAAAVAQNQAKIVALSIVYPTDDLHLEQELKLLRSYLPPEVVIIVGGRASGNYREILNAIGAVNITDMASFRAMLETLRLR
jgi:methanogenic corrinoid protein MtbC1